MNNRSNKDGNAIKTISLKPDRFTEHDVVVVGGSLGGVLAAAHLATKKFKVILLEKRGFLGGTLSAGLQPFFPIGLEKSDTLLSRIWTRLIQCGGVDADGRLHIEQLKAELEECLLEISGIELRYHTEILSVDTAKKGISAILSQCKSGIVRHQARAFLDASQNYDLARLLPNTGPNDCKLRIYTARVRIGGCTHVAAEASVVPSFNNFSAYLGNGSSTVVQTGNVPGKFARGVERDPFDQGIPHTVADVLGMCVRIRRGFFSLDRLIEFSFLQRIDENPHVQCRDLAWKILNFWKETLPGFEDSYLCLSAQELDMLPVRLPQIKKAPRFLAEKGTSHLREFHLQAEGRSVRTQETACDPVSCSSSCQSLDFDNLWLPGDSRLLNPEKPFWQMSSPGLSAHWIGPLVKEITKARTKARVGNVNRADFSINVSLVEETDIVVVGGGPSGVAAAIAAARHGARVTLVEHSYDLGGNGTTGGVTSFAGGSRGGIYEELLACLHGEMFKFPHNQAFDPEGYRWVLDRLLRENKITLILGALLVNVEHREKRVNSVIVRHCDGFRRLTARFFIDASGDAELSQRAGVPTVVGREKDGRTQPVSLMYQIAYAEGASHLNWFWRIPHGRFLVNATRIAALGVDSADLTRAEIEGRKQMREQVNALCRQFGYRLVHSGPRVGVRETRRIEGHYTLTVKDAREGRHFDDGIGKCNYFLDIHNPDGKIGTFTENVPEYEIPFRSLIPKGIDNLLVAGRCISATHEAMASLRVMPPCFIIGQAAGTAAAFCAQTGTPPIELSPRILRNALIYDGVDLER